MAGLRFELTRDAEEFASRAEAFLAARIERNVIATVLINLRHDHLGGEQEPLFVCGVDADGELGAVALRTPPWPMLVTEVDASDADALLDAWLDADPSPPGVSRRELGEPGPQRGSKRATGEDRGQLSAVG